jgi:hypothetical protein
MSILDTRAMYHLRPTAHVFIRKTKTYCAVYHYEIVPPKSGHSSYSFIQNSVTVIHMSYRVYIRFAWQKVMIKPLFLELEEDGS